MPSMPDRYTLKSFLVGCVLSVLVVVMSQYSVNILHASFLSIDHMPAGGIFIFFIFVGLLVPCMESLGTSLRFSRSELILIYVMLLVSSSIATMGLGTQLLSMLAGPAYYANPTNQWDTLIHPHIHPWFSPQDPEAVRTFYEGLNPGEQIPWHAWTKTLALWLPFMVVLYFVMICVGVILRKQWVEHERLSFPLTALPLDMVQEEEGRRSRPFFRTAPMWLGFAIPFFVGSLNALHHYHESFPGVELVKSLPVVHRLWDLEFRISFPIIGFAYFISSKLAFSFWFFNVTAQALWAYFHRTGITTGENMSVFGAWSPIFKHLGMGAIFVLVVYGLWTSRTHLLTVVRNMLPFNSSEDDSEEILSYRASAWGLLVGILLLAAWLHLAGLEFRIAVAFVLLALLIFTAVVRVVAQGGLPTLIAPSIAPSQLVSSIGAGAVGPAGLTVLGYSYIWSGDIRTFVMSSSMHGMKLGNESGARSARPLFWAMMAAVLIGVIGSTVVVMYLAYNYGGLNLQNWYFQGNTRVAFNYIAKMVSSPPSPNMSGWWYKGAGAAIMLGMMVLQRQFYWWPIHPLGFAIGANYWMNKIWFSIFLSWLIKGAILKYGGGKTFRRARPFFLGLVLGQYSCAGFWFLVDIITDTVGNQIFWI